MFMSEGKNNSFSTMELLLIFAFAIIESQAMSLNDPKRHMGRKPWFCGKLKCPEYVVLKKTIHYEKRCYEDSLWVSSSYSSAKPTKGLRLMYRRLWNYFNGDNKEKLVLKLTSPVLLKYSLIPHHAEKKRAEMHFFYPDQNAVKTVLPVNNNVGERRYPEMCFYVTRFVKHVEMTKQLNAFRALLKEDGVNISQNYPFYLATYYKTERGKRIEIMFKE